MKRKRFYYICIVLLIALYNSNAISDNKSNLQVIINKVNNLSNSINNGKGHIVYEWTRVDTLSMQKELDSHPQGSVGIVNRNRINVNFAFKNIMYLSDQKSQSDSYKGISHYIDYVIANNGEVVKVIMKDAPVENGIFDIQGYIAYNHFQPSYDPREYGGLKVLGVPLTSILSNSSKYNNTTIIDEIMYDDESCIIIKSYVENDTLTMYLSQNQMYLPLYIERTYNKKGLKIIQYFKHKNYSDDIWFLKSLKTEVYSLKDVKDKYELINYETYSVQDDFVLNTTVSDSIGNFEFPKGLLVDDRIRNIKYRVE